jgi:D-threo-aldose 1-dehydrogenase
VLAAAVFNSGVLARPGEGAWFDYAPASRETVVRVGAMRSACAEFGVDLRAAALQYPLRHPGVAAVVVGMASAAEVVANLSLIRAPIPPELWDRLEAL